MPKPSLLDNREAATSHETGLRWLAAQDGAHPLAVATGYVDLAGLELLAALTAGRPVRLLIGAVPDAGLGAATPLDSFQTHLARLAAERDFSRFPPSRAARRLEAVARWLDSGAELAVRRYVQRFLHGKAYLLGSEHDPVAGIVSSANLTGAGMERNLELGLTDHNPPVVTLALRWYDGLWAEATDFREELRALLFPDPGFVDPQTVYLRALLELREPESDDPERASRPRVELAPFQRDGYERARAIARRYGGVIYADGVGTGKTEIGLAFIEERTNEDGVYALVIAPAQLAERWRERIERAKLSARVVSFQELAADEQLAPEAPNAHRVLPERKDSYRLVIVDEGHALRNQDTTWYRAMERLLGGSEKQLVLLSATPINNGLWDLYNLVMLFARHDRALTGIGIDSIRDLFLDAGANERDPEALSPEALFPLADAVSVRRDRSFIESEYADQQFPDGTAVRFPAPRLTTERYDLDAGHPGLVEEIAALIEALTMARYRPSAYELGGEEKAAQAQLGGLLQSGLLKRFESCWRACLETVEKMLAAHDAFLAGWTEGRVLSGDALAAAADAGGAESGAAARLEELLAEEGGRDDVGRVADFDPVFAQDVEEDRGRLVAMRDLLSGLRPQDDPKLATLRRVLGECPARKVAVFATYAATVRYLDEHLGADPRGRERIVVIGNETTPDQRTAALGRFAPHTVVREGYEPPDGEVDLLISTDVLSEGQNLQQAQAVVSYDMPWNPQRVVQRNGRVIRLRSEHDQVLLTTMLPEPGELERLLRLEQKILAKLRAAQVYGMETEVIEGAEDGELQQYAERLAAGDAELLAAAEEESGAFVGEQLRRLIDRAIHEGEIERISRLPWGEGAAFRQTPDGRSRGPAGVFFAVRTRPMPDDGRGYRYWRYVELAGGALESGDLEILRRIDPAGGEALSSEELEVDLEPLWERAAADIVEKHNERVDFRASEDPVGPKQRWALEVLRDPAVSLPPGAERAEEALSVGRSSAVRRALGDIQDRIESATITLDEAATEIVAVVEDYGLRGIDPPPQPEKVEVEDLGVVCWMAVVGAG